MAQTQTELELGGVGELELLSRRMSAVGVPFDRPKLEELLAKADKVLWKSEHARKINTTRIRNLLAAMDSNGRVHPTWKPDGAVSGRWTCETPSVQNLIQLVKQCLSEDVWQVDVCQMELYIAAKLAGQAWLVDTYESGEDVHTHTADLVGCDRKTGKLLNLSTLYGATAIGTSGRLNTSEEAAQDLLDAWWQANDAIAAYRTTVLTEARANGFVEDFYGHRRVVDETDEKYETKTWSFHIQSTAASVMKQAFLRLCRAGRQPLAVIHDAFWVDQKDMLAASEAIVESGRPEFTLRVESSRPSSKD